ncbi:MAG: flavin reductase family protein [candidate division Zixibacteria bacterium]|nr:flavin reductase family protein [candidate division Zixibacteria bacterium]
MSETPPFRSVDPETLPRRDVYRLLLFCVSPRPIAFTSTLSPDGKPNLAPFSFFMAGGANPPSVVISPVTGREGGYKDTLRNIEATGEFVINTATHEIKDRMNLASFEFPYGVNEFEEAGFTPLPSVRIKPDRVAESPLQMECRLFRIVRHGEGPLSANYIIGEVVYFHMAERVWDGDTVDARRIDAIGRMGGEWYCRANEPAMFEMTRPQR